MYSDDWSLESLQTFKTIFFFRVYNDNVAVVRIVVYLIML
jgi:hypothetical protein